MEKIYLILINERDRDAQRFWVIFGVMNIINVALFASISKNLSQTHIIAPICVVGIVLCIIWALAELRMSAWIFWWEEKLRKLEPYYFKSITKLQPPNFKIFVERKTAVKKGISTRVTGCLLPIIFLILWIYILL